MYCNLGVQEYNSLIVGRPTPESLTRVQHDIQFAFRETPNIGKWFPHLQIGVFEFDHGRKLRKAVAGMLHDIEPGSSPTVRRDVASTTVKLLAIENVGRRGLPEERVHAIRDRLRQDQIGDAGRNGMRRIDVETQWEIATMLVDALTDTTNDKPLSSIGDTLITATALSVNPL